MPTLKAAEFVAEAISALSALLWHWRILQLIVNAIAFALRKLMNIGGAVGLGSAATIFLGMVEAPLLIRPYLAKLERAELFTAAPRNIGDGGCDPRLQARQIVIADIGAIDPKPFVDTI